ncbi:hypothetical protein D3C75_898860 [compost metagenome]
MAAVANQVTDVGIGLAAELGTVVVDAEFYFQLFTRLGRYIMNNDALLFRGDRRDCDRRYAGVSVRDLAKGFGRQFSQFRQWLVAVQHPHHQIGRIITLVECRQLIVQLAARLVL